MKILSFINAKGGVGKTSIAVNLADGLSRRKKKVCLIDLDPQASASSWLSLGNVTRSIYEFFAQRYPQVSSGTCELANNVHTVKTRYDVIPSRTALAGIEHLISGDINAIDLFKKACNALPYDYILIDSPPNLGVYAMCAMQAADEIVIPAEPSYLSLDAIGTFDEMLGRITGVTDKNHILINRFNGRTRHAKECLAMLKEHFGERLSAAIIPDTVRIAEAAALHRFIEDSKHEKAIKAFRDLEKELI